MCSCQWCHDAVMLASGRVVDSIIKITRSRKRGFFPGKFHSRRQFNVYAAFMKTWKYEFFYVRLTAQNGKTMLCDCLMSLSVFLSAWRSICRHQHVSDTLYTRRGRRLKRPPLSETNFLDTR